MNGLPREKTSEIKSFTYQQIDTVEENISEHEHIEVKMMKKKSSIGRKKRKKMSKIEVIYGKHQIV